MLADAAISCGCASLYKPREHLITMSRGSTRSWAYRARPCPYLKYRVIIFKKMKGLRELRLLRTQHELYPTYIHL